MRNVSPNVARGLMAAARAHTAAISAKLAALGYDDFPFASASLLWLMDEGGTRSTILAQRTGVSKQAMSQLVRVMERQGYLEQAVDPTDSRAKVVRMTKRGQAVKMACEEAREQLNRQVVKALGVKEAERLQASLDAAASMFGEIIGSQKK